MSPAVWDSAPEGCASLSLLLPASCLCLPAPAWPRGPVAARASPALRLLPSQSRRAHSIDLKGTVVIFDEAHNVVSVRAFPSFRPLSPIPCPPPPRPAPWDFLGPRLSGPSTPGGGAALPVTCMPCPTYSRRLCSRNGGLAWALEDDSLGPGWPCEGLVF